MVTKNISAIFLIATMVVSGGCGKDAVPCTKAVYGFSATAAFTPSAEIYHLGDTLYLSSVIPKQLTDISTNRVIDYSNSFGIGGTLSFNVLDSISRTRYFDRFKFEVIPGVGTVTDFANDPRIGVVIRYQENSNYEFSMGIILKEKGDYALSLSDFQSAGQSNGGCSKAGFKMSLTNTNPHLNLYQQALGVLPDGIYDGKVYCFRVID